MLNPGAGRLSYEVRRRNHYMKKIKASLMGAALAGALVLNM